MGRFRAEAVVVRDVNGIRVVFYDRESIYLRDERGNWTVFHRWFAPRGSYNGGWRQFRHLLLYEKNLTSRHCFHLAFRWDILSKSSKEPDLSKFKIEERF